MSADKRSAQQIHFDNIYEAFHGFYVAALKKLGKHPHEKIRLELTTTFFDDVELLKHVQPVFSQGVSNVEEKRAIARVAYRDAMQAHYFGSMFERREPVKTLGPVEK